MDFAMYKRQSLVSLLLMFVAMLGVLAIILYPCSRVGECPGQFVLYAALNHDESQLLIVTLPRSPFG